MVDTDGMTAEQWLAEQFEYEVCAECSGDVEDHDVVPLLGNWFARCKAPSAYPKLISEDQLSANERINLAELAETFGFESFLPGPLNLADYDPRVRYFDLWRDEYGGSASVNIPGHEFDITMGVEING